MYMNPPYVPHGRRWLPYRRQTASVWVNTPIYRTVWLAKLTDHLGTSITGLSREVRSRAHGYDEVRDMPGYAQSSIPVSRLLLCARTSRRHCSRCLYVLLPLITLSLSLSMREVSSSLGHFHSWRDLSRDFRRNVSTKKEIKIEMSKKGEKGKEKLDAHFRE